LFARYTAKQADADCGILHEERIHIRGVQTGYGPADLAQVAVSPASRQMEGYLCKTFQSRTYNNSTTILLSWKRKTAKRCDALFSIDFWVLYSYNEMSCACLR